MFSICVLSVSEGPFDCKPCRKSFTSQRYLSRHYENKCKYKELQHKVKKKCSYCGQEMLFEFQLRRHIEKKHPDQWVKLETENQTTPYKIQQGQFNKRNETSVSNSFNTSNSSWEDVNKEEVKQTHSTKKFCKRCERSFNAAYYKSHICVSSKIIDYHKINSHKAQRILEKEAFVEIEQYKGKKTPEVGSVAGVEDSSQDGNKLQVYKEHNVNDKPETDCTKPKGGGVTIDSIPNQLKDCATDIESEGLRDAELIFCHQCNSNHNTKYLCKIQCNLCSFVGNSKQNLQLHKKKQHCDKNVLYGRYRLFLLSFYMCIDVLLHLLS